MTSLPTSSPSKRRAVIYARYSTDRQDAASIEDQYRRCQRWASEHGYSIVDRFKDEAISGSHMDRAGLQRLLAQCRGTGGSPFGFVIVDDLSRLSRDLGDMWGVVFNDLRAEGVVTIDCQSGTKSSDDSAEMLFGMNAITSTMFLKQLRRQTHRGLEGRALKGFCTGGRTYGFESVVEANPGDPLHPRKLRRVHVDQAAIVLRVFNLYAQGSSYGAIAALLNSEKLPAPYDRIKGHELRRGWAAGTIRAMLLNRAYLGEFVWNRRQYVQTRRNGRRVRKVTKRPEGEHRSWSDPTLAVVTQDVWDAVQARLKSRTSARPNGTGKTTYLLSGLLKCAICGGSMSVIGAAVRDGRRYPQFGCSAHKNKGDAICPNGMSISETKLNEMILGALRDTLLAPGLVQRFVERFNAKVAEAQRTGGRTDEEAAAIDGQIAAQKERVRKYVDAVVEASWSPAMAERLREEEARLETLQRQRAARSAVKKRAQVLPLPSVAEGYLRDLLRTLESTPQRGRELLGKHLTKITMTPMLDAGRRYYEATTAFDLSVALAGGREAEVRGKVGCGDRI
jgi:site-specific DNA recombinase